MAAPPRVVPHDTGGGAPEWRPLSSSSDDADGDARGGSAPGSPDSPLHSPLGSPRRGFSAVRVVSLSPLSRCIGRHQRCPWPDPLCTCGALLSVQGPPADKGPGAAAAASTALRAASGVQVTAAPSGAHDARDSDSEVSAEDAAAVTAVGTDFASVYDDGDGARSSSPPAHLAPSPLDDEEGDTSPAGGAAHDSDDEYGDNVPSYGRTYASLGRSGELPVTPSWLGSSRLPLDAPLTDPAPKRHRRRNGEHRSSRSRALAPGAQFALAAPAVEAPVAQPLAWGSAGAPDVESSDNKNRAVAAWVASNSPQALRQGARNPWAWPLLEPPRRGAASAPITPSAPSGEAGRMAGRQFGGPAYSMPHSPGGSPGQMLAAQQQQMQQQQQPDGNAANPMAALSHLVAELAGVQRALLAQQAVPSTPPSGAQQHPVDAPWATPGYRMRQPAWDADAGDGTPQHRVSNTGSATKPPLSGGRAGRGHEHAPAVDATSPGLTRRSLLLQRVQQQAAAGHHGGGDDDGEEGSAQTSPEEWARSGGRAPSRSSGTFSFREDRPRAASPKMWQGEDADTGESPRSGSRRAPANSGAGIARRGSAASTTGSAPSEMGSEMDAFRAGGGLVPTSRQRRQSTIPEEDARESEGDDDLMERIRADVIVPDDSSPQRHSAAEPTASPQRVATRRAALAERRVTAMELALEEAVAAAESAGWERDALVVRTAEAEAAATAAQEAVAHVQAALAAEQAQNEYLRRLLARAEELRDVARADAATLRERALAADLQLRQLLETLDARDAEALGVRARLRNDKARMVALQAERDQAVEHLRVSHDRGQLLHRVLGLALAACFVMALRLVLGTRPTVK